MHTYIIRIRAEREREMEELTEDEKKALRGSKFAPLPSATNQARPQSRLAHPGGPMKTNKEATLAKFLERKLQEPNGLASVNPKLVELAVRNAKQTVQCSGASTSGRVVHVNKFDDDEDLEREDINEVPTPKRIKPKKKKKKKKRNKKKKQKKLDDSIADISNRPKKQFKLQAS